MASVTIKGISYTYGSSGTIFTAYSNANMYANSTTSSSSAKFVSGNKYYIRNYYSGTLNPYGVAKEGASSVQGCAREDLFPPATVTLTFYGNGATSATSGHTMASDGKSDATSNYSWSTDNVKNIWNVSSLFTKTGYHRESEAKAWRVGSATATTYWNEATQDITSQLTATSKTVKLYANWAANTYTVVYNANGGSGTTGSSTHTYDSAKVLTANGYSKAGYEFKGWATSQANADAEIVKYKDKESVKNLTSTNNGSVTLFAVWHKGDEPTPPTPTTQEIYVKSNGEYTKAEAFVKVGGSYVSADAYIKSDGNYIKL